MVSPVELLEMAPPMEAAVILLNSLGLGGFVPVLRPLHHYLTSLGIIPVSLVAFLVTIWSIWKAVTRYLMVTVEISSSDLVCAVQHLLITRGITGYNMVAALEQKSESQAQFGDEKPGELITFSWWSTRIMAFYPLSAVWLREDGTLFKVQAKKATEYFNDARADRLVYSLSCFGYSSEPIKKVLRASMDNSLQYKSDKIAIWLPSSQPTQWYRGSLRASRDAKTLAIDHQILENLLEDINTFLRFGSEKNYHSRGIPYRRGYMLCGPPGTGKTSLVHVIASKFRLPIFYLSLCASTMTDESLMSLTMRLPRRCLLLIEDIDAAGLGRNSSGSEQRITLSGYLNATDGFAAPEGHVSFITTNNPQSLDLAIKRPGRVDYDVYLTNASKSQAKQLFQNNYCASMHEDLESTAQKFADEVPELLFSPAEIQQYLLKLEHCDSPETALADAPAWVVRKDLG
ncbi:hypothetical protein CEP54_015094 [Fusarium duplospermum]|uniref:AAA+ ATPase domain-containing protein n=1 Tax=Fusarium duplospermum TaxID=1325734 RepID=A0A428NRJ5_9HYPO|nr:hypothetical protein CEP54_015094 [Fusarium duplospermum]